MKKTILISYLFFLAFIMAFSSARSETIYLKDKTILKGKILSFYEDRFVIGFEGGEKHVIEKSRIEKIEFVSSEKQLKENSGAREADLLKPDPKFESPIKTFLSWKKAAIKENLENMADCFVSVSRSDQLSELKNFSKKQIRNMKKLTKKTDFTFTQPLFDGDTAYLSVTRKYKGKISKTVIRFQREGSNWKMIPD